MKPILFIIICLIVLSFSAKAQLSDSVMINKLSINGFCLCKTTLDSLNHSYKDIKEVEVEEMDIAKGCFGQDSRFIAGKGYASEKQPGIIFQKDQESDYISKIRLTKQFKGVLPGGQYIDLSKLLLKDLFKMYPLLKDKWGSRGCSDYWNFSNDTLSFFVKIDKTKQPQFPIDETYYADKPVEAVDMAVSCYSVTNYRPAPILDGKEDPILFIDSVRVSISLIKNLDPNEIASLTIYKGADAIEKMESATNGLIYIETRKVAKAKYWKYFKSKSAEYGKLISSPQGDSNIQYILNKRILTGNFDGDLSSVNDSTFKGLQIIDKQTLEKDYHVLDKELGVIIMADRPKNLYHGGNRF